jgi:transcriptional regulator
MHPAPLFRETRIDVLLDRIRAWPLGLIAVNGTSAPIVAHTPVLVQQVTRKLTSLRFHLSANNPVTVHLEGGAAATIVFTGPDAYISPDWYGEVPDQVPTWNYLSVEAEGVVAPADAAAFLDDLSAEFEARLLPKPPWTRAKMNPAAFERMLRGIRAFEMVPARFEGISKLSQNKPPEARIGVIEALSATPGGLAIAQEMRKLDE